MGARCEFILLSRSKSIVDMLNPKPKYFDEEAFPEKPWCMLNFMLIEQGCNIAERLGVGFVHDIAGSEASPRSIFIRLE